MSGWDFLQANTTNTSRGDGFMALALLETGANRWSGRGPLPQGAPAEDVKAFYAQARDCLHIDSTVTLQLSLYLALLVRCLL